MDIIGKLFSYVVDHDTGFAPNPYHGICTLTHCKTSDMIFTSDVGDWIIGTSGLRSDVSIGEHGRLIYAMRIDNKITRAEYYSDSSYKCKIPSSDGSYEMRCGDNLEQCRNDHTPALISNHFYYFGRLAKRFPKRFVEYPIEKKGPKYKYKMFTEEFIKDFMKWLEQYPRGRHGNPCAICHN